MNYNIPANAASIKKVSAALTEHGFIPLVVDTKEEALKKIKELIPAGVSVMNGSSVTLEQIGYTDYLKSGKHQWKDLHAGVTSESDPLKRAELRKNAITSEYYLGSVHALTETGEMVIASNTGSQLPHLAFTSKNLILVVGTQKITATLAEALKRLEDYVIPLEDEHMMQLFGTGTLKSKTLILHKESPMIKRNVYIILVKENLGF